jgi:hypothetical protein
MSRHYRIGADIQGEDLRQELHAILNPLPAMLEASTGMKIFTAEIGATDATGNAMIVRRRLQGDERFPWLGPDIHAWYQWLTLKAWQTIPLAASFGWVSI